MAKPHPSYLSYSSYPSYLGDIDRTAEAKFAPAM